PCPGRACPRTDQPPRGTEPPKLRSPGRGLDLRTPEDREHRTQGPMVAADARDRRRTRGVRPLRTRRRALGRRLPLHGRRGRLPLAVLLAGHPGDLRRRPPVLAGDPRALGAAGAAGHLLLLPQGLLPLVLPLPARVRRRRKEG